MNLIPEIKTEKISFGGIPNSRNVLFLQIFLKHAAKPRAGNTSAGFPLVKWPQILLNLTWLCTNLLRNLPRNLVEPDLALGTSNIRLFSQPRSGNCNLFVLMLFPPGPAFKIAYIWFWISFISHVISYHHHHIFFLLGVFSSLGWDFGTFCVFDGRCLHRGAEDEQI